MEKKTTTGMLFSEFFTGGKKEFGTLKTASRNPATAKPGNKEAVEQSLKNYESD